MRTSQTDWKLPAQTAICWFAGLVLISGGLLTQAQTTYSSSAEYQQMLNDLHTAAPSPALIATGKLPQADVDMELAVHEDNHNIRWSTSASQFHLDKENATLRWSSRRTSASWVISANGCDKMSPTPVRVSRIARSKNQWTVSTTGPCGSSTLIIELVTDVLTRLTYLGTVGSYSKEVQIHVDGGEPFFGLGERFWQAALKGTNLDVRPQDRYGEPGHNGVYMAIPLVYSSAGFGLYADTAFDTNFRFNQEGSAFDLKIANHPASLYLLLRK